MFTSQYYILPQFPRKAVLQYIQYIRTFKPPDKSTHLPCQHKVLLKIIQARLQHYTENFQMLKLGLEKAEEPEIKLPTFAGSQRKQGNSRKTPTSASLTTPKSLIVWIITNCGKLGEMDIAGHLTRLLKNLYVGQKATVSNEHWGARVSFRSGFLGVYAQEWDCWVIWQFYFQFFKESPHRSPQWLYQFAFPRTV